MKRISKEVFDHITLNASLQRLGVVELEERMEFSPLLVEAGLRDTETETSTTCCVCKIPEDHKFPDLLIYNPGTGDGSTGPTDGGLIR